MNLDALNQQLILLFSLIFVGWVAARVGLLPKNANKCLADLVINISCPATTLYAVASSSRALSNGQVLQILLISALLYGALILLAIPVTRLMGLRRQESGIYRFMLIFSNVGFLGYPVLQALSGADAVFVAAMYNLVFQLLVYTYGVSLISGGTGGISWKRFLSPMLISSVLALVLYLAGVSFHPMVTQVLGLLDQITAPTSMLAIGCTLAAFPLKRVFTNWRIYVVSLVKLVAIPVVVFLVLRLVIQDQMILMVMTVLSAMPVATNATLLCAKYDGDQETAASGVFLSTLLSVFVLPVLLRVLF